MRVVFYTGKGGVGKTSISCATGVRAAESGKRTLVLSLDSAHSVADAFDVERRLLDRKGGRPYQVAPRLFIQELDVQREIERWWNEIYSYLSLLFATTGLDGVVADELAILPGMEEVSLLLYINQYYRESAFDVLILDCAPTGESLRFISVPTALDWYMRRIFRAERLLFRAARPVMKAVDRSLPLPEDDYFAAIERLGKQLAGVERIIQDPRVTTVRLVTLPEKMVVKETQRAFAYFSLYGLLTDAVIVNKMIPHAAGGKFFDLWREQQRRHLDEIRELFAPVPVWTVEMMEGEVVGIDGLRRLAARLYGDIDPLAVHFQDMPLRYRAEGDRLELVVRVPFASKEDVDITKVDHELVLDVGGFRKHVTLPRRFAAARPVGAKVSGGTVTVTFEEAKADE
ncbi:MAG: ArsA family ATPase [Acidobacteria bacterium]|nr:MAG: ArsA family ATPase [Acidobacteriota bacterium]